MPIYVVLGTPGARDGAEIPTRVAFVVSGTCARALP
jgi:hypothetical protein